MMRLPFTVLLSALHSLDSDAIRNWVDGYDKVLGSVSHFRRLPANALGLTAFDAVYYSSPKPGSSHTLLELMRRTDSVTESGVVVYKWRELSEGEDVTYYGAALYDGGILISNNKDMLVAAASDRNHALGIPPLLENTAAIVPYWISREPAAGALDFGDEAFRRNIRRLSLHMTADGSTEIIAEGTFLNLPDLQEPTSVIPLHKRGSEYVAYVDITKPSRAPDPWAGIMAIFGFELSV